MNKSCKHCSSGKLEKHKTFSRDIQWSCGNCGRIYRKADQDDVTAYNDVSEGELILK